MSNSSKFAVFEPGQTIYEAKSLADDLFIIQTGEVGVFKVTPEEKWLPIAIIGPNNFLGELAMAKGHYRSSTALALTRVTAIKVSKKEFDKQIKDATPWLRALFMNLVDRLQDTNEVLKRNQFVDEKVQERIKECVALHKELKDKIAA